MFKNLQARPTQAEIDAVFGFPVPEFFAQFLWYIYDTTGKLEAGNESYYDQLTGLYMSGCDMRYDGTPPEFFTFGNPGVDGIHFGFILHDERLGPDWPVGHFNPSDSDGVTFVGANPREGLANILVAKLRQIQDENESDVQGREQIYAAAQALGLTLDASRPTPLDFGFGAEEGSQDENAGKLRRIVPKLPAGWLLLRTLDGLGVAAPAEQFHPDDQARVLPEYEESRLDFDVPEEELERVESMLDEGYPASAVLRLRDANYTGDFQDERIDLMVRAYEMLGRPHCAKALLDYHRPAERGSQMEEAE